MDNLMPVTGESATPDLMTQGDSSTPQSAESQGLDPNASPTSSPEEVNWNDVPFNQHPRWQQLTGKLSDYEQKLKEADSKLSVLTDLQNIGQQIQSQYQPQYQQQYQPPAQELTWEQQQEMRMSQIADEKFAEHIGYQKYNTELNEAKTRFGLSEQEAIKLKQKCDEMEFPYPLVMAKDMYEDKIKANWQMELMKKQKESAKADMGTARGGGGLPSPTGGKMTHAQLVAMTQQIMGDSSLQ